MKSPRIAAVTLACLCATAAHADDPFQLALTVDGSSAFNQGYSKLEDLISQFSNAELSEVPGYTVNSAARGEINLRGLSGVVLSYEANSPTLRLQVAALGIDEQFAGANRDASEDLLDAWFKGEGKAQVTKLLNALAAESPIDPIAGNPNSLMAGMAGADFANAAGLPQMVGKAGEAGGERNFFGISARFGQYSQRNFDSQVLSVPMSYTHLMSDPRYALVIDLPLTYVKTEGSDTYSGSLGVGLRVPVAERWSLTPAVRAGAAGSVDLGAAGIIYSGSLTSHYAFQPVKQFDLALVNMVAYYSTDSVQAGDYDIGYDLQNTVFRNGLLASRGAGFSLIGTPMQWELQAVRTDYFGDELYSKSYQDFAVSLGTRKQSGRLVWNALRLGLTYTVGKGDVDGVGANLGYTF